MPKSPLTADGAKIPPSLKLEFSRAADYNRIGKIFEPNIKGVIDPQNFVVKREEKILRGAVNKGGAAFLSDDNDELFTLSVAYHVKKDKKAPARSQHDYTEVGTSLARMGGYNSAQLIVAALTLKEWWENPPKNMIVTEILPNNVPSLKTYSRDLEWKKIDDKATANELHKLCNETISAADKGRPTIWFNCAAQVLKKQADTILKFMDQGGLVNKHTGHKIAVKFNALNDIGLTRKRLEAMASGVVSRKTLQGIGAP
jgi:hypothetical protein